MSAHDGEGGGGLLLSVWSGGRVVVGKERRYDQADQDRPLRSGTALL